MDVAVAISQGVGLAVACGLAGLLPLGVLAIAALIGWTSGALGIIEGTPLLAATWLVGALEATARAVLPRPVRIALSAAGGGAACEIAAGGALPWVGLVIGTVVGASTAWTSTRMIDRAISGGGTRWGVTALVGAAAIVVAALSIIPFVGFALVLVVLWATTRSRKNDHERYAGLRVLR